MRVVLELSAKGLGRGSRRHYVECRLLINGTGRLILALPPIPAAGFFSSGLLPFFRTAMSADRTAQCGLRRYGRTFGGRRTPPWPAEKLERVCPQAQSERLRRGSVRRAACQQTNGSGQSLRFAEAWLACMVNKEGGSPVRAAIPAAWLQELNPC